MKGNKLHTPTAPGSIEHLGIVDKLDVFAFQFHQWTSCSDATAEDFVGVFEVTALADIPWGSVKEPQRRNVGFNFFCLDKDDESKLEVSYTFPVRQNELQHVKSLKEAIKLYYNVKEKAFTKQDIACIEVLSNQEKFCEFSGGGDLIIHGPDKTAVLTSELCCNLPVHDGEEVFSGVLEAKNVKEVQTFYQIIINFY